MPRSIRFTRLTASMAPRPENLRAQAVLRGHGIVSGSQTGTQRGLDLNSDGGGWKAV